MIQESIQGEDGRQQRRPNPPRVVSRIPRRNCRMNESIDTIGGTFLDFSDDQQFQMCDFPMIGLAEKRRISQMDGIQGSGDTRDDSILPTGDVTYRQVRRNM